MYSNPHSTLKDPSLPPRLGPLAKAKASASPARARRGGDMTTEEFLKHAEECDRLAAMAKMEANRQALLASAEMWRKMAAHTTSDDGVATAPRPFERCD